MTGARQADDGRRDATWGTARGPDTTAKGPRPGARCPRCRQYVDAVDVGEHGKKHRALDLGEGLIGSVWRTRSTSGRTATAVAYGADHVEFVNANGGRWTVAMVDVVAFMELVELGTDV